MGRYGVVGGKSERQGTWRKRVMLAAAVFVCAMSAVYASSVVHANGQGKAPVQRTQKAQDIVVAGGIDGRVYAINAWTGDVMWMFDSGGPMVDSANCGMAPPPPPRSRKSQPQRVHPREEEDSEWLPTTEDADGRSAMEQQWRGQGTSEDAVARTSIGSEFVGLSQMIPSYDGRLYHIDGSRVHELEMSMVDIINANGPVRLSSPTALTSKSGGKGDSLSDLLLFGEKSTKIFSLDAIQGVIQPYLATSSSSSPTILFGRAEFKTKAVEAHNMSAARCFTISEYFLQFAEQSKCSMNEDNDDPIASPVILVLPKDPDSPHPDDEESTIAGYDPWTNKQLWELQIPQFDVIAVFGVSATRGAAFFKWNIDGPSSSASAQKKTGLTIDHSATIKATVATTQKSPEIGHGTTTELNNESKHLVKTVARDWPTMESQFRLRLLDGNYFLEHNDEDDSESAATSASSYYNGDDLRPKRKRRVFWESMESGGKRGVFITYYHVGAMTLGTMVGCMLIAWGFYVKGLSASGVIKSLDQQFLPSGHIHQLTIERPGHDNVTITSSITRSLLMDAAASFGFASRQLPMLDNGDETYVGTDGSTSNQVKLDPETEAMLLEKFSKMVALEAAAALSGSRFSNDNLMKLECDPDSSTASTTRTSSTLTLLSDSPSGRTHRLSLMGDESDADSSLSAFEVANGRSNLTEDNEGRIVPVIEELENSSFESLSDVKDCDCGAVEIDDCEPDQVIRDSTRSSTESDPRSAASWESDEVSSGDRSETSGSGESASDTTELDPQDEQTNGSTSAIETSNPRKSSNASSASSGANEAEVLFPFVCQSRFANEFVELSALGKGGFGQVTLAENRLDGRKYAIKRVGLHLKHQTSKTLQKFLREVKILALLDHPNIVRYYQAWLEKVEEGTFTSTGLRSDGGSDATGTAPPRNYSMSNLLAPISEMDYSNQHRSVASFYSNGSFGDNDGGFDWERDSANGEEETGAWREEDITPSAATRSSRPHQIIEPNLPVKAPGAARLNTDGDDSSSYSTDRCDHWLYIQMQYCAGRNLGDYLAIPTRSMEMPKLFKIFTQIASAIAHVHSCGLIHRDLKPANIFVADTEGDSIKLGDFGLSRYAANVNLATSTTTTSTTTSTIEEHSTFLNGGTGGHVAQYSVSKWSVSMSNMSESQDITAGVGTYLYASPEQVAGKKYNAKTDMYSLGMILFELCHERFTTTMERYVTLRNARERIYPPEFQWRKKSPEIMEMLDRLLHCDPMERPDAAEVVQWSQELYEISLAHFHVSTSKAVLRSPIHHARSFNGTIPSLNMDHVNDSASSAFSLQVEARMDTSVDDSGGSGERRLPNHNLLKEICDVIAVVSGGRMEIKKCGLHLQDGGAQVLDFVLDPHVREDEESDEDDAALVKGQQKELITVIQALPGVHTVRLGI